MSPILKIGPICPIFFKKLKICLKLHLGHATRPVVTENPHAESADTSVYHDSAIRLQYMKDSDTGCDTYRWGFSSYRIVIRIPCMVQYLLPWSHVLAQDQWADVPTKPLSASKFCFFYDKLGVSQLYTCSTTLSL